MRAFRFCANLDFLFQETDLLSRYFFAERCGFKGVETADPYRVPLKEIAQVKAKSGLCQVLINTPTDGCEDGRYGYASLPGQQDKFREGLCKAAMYATELNCRFVHIMSGTMKNTENADDYRRAYVANLKEAVSVLEPLRIYGLIEPINTYSITNYYMDSYEKAVSVIEEVGSDSIRLLMDIYHMQIIKGNLTRSIAQFLPFVKHIQIAQVPGRNEPDCLGEINYDYIMNLLDELCYEGWVGLEYCSKRATEAGLTWFKKNVQCSGVV